MRTLILILFVVAIGHLAKSESWIRINQVGYLPDAVKVAVVISDEAAVLSGFELCDAIDNQIVFRGRSRMADASYFGMKSAGRLDFSAFQRCGSYYIRMGAAQSPVFRIGSHVYDGAADYLLNYMRQQRCGYNPYLKDSCHVHDGFIVDHPTRDGEIIDVKGGWHDASDYLQYSTTSINAVFHLLLAWQQNPTAFGDWYNARGEKGANGIPDILDEARWGLEWMLKMNPDSVTFFNQIADDRDHKSFRLPNEDNVSYGNGLYRPVYFVTGKPQGLASFKNRTTGVSSITGKFCSSFAIGARLFQAVDSVFASVLEQKVKEAWRFALHDLGETQTACFLSPYFYEEGNYSDDLQLAAWQMYDLTGDNYFYKQACYWGALEPISPWIVQNGARHYQSYPFVNAGHGLMSISSIAENKQFANYYRDGLQQLKNRGEKNAFFIGIPFIWCSNNLVAGAITQARLYHQATGDTSFLEIEAALRDWLLGCNPWGTSMICGYPQWGDFPADPHSAITLIRGETTHGGLVDGPVYKHIFEGLRGVVLRNADVYAPFQHGQIVYHDDLGDYSTNEPTMDGTASLSFYLSSMQLEGHRQSIINRSDEVDAFGAVIRKNVNEKKIYLLFSADEYDEGFSHVISILDEQQVKASFFLTGKFLSNKHFNKSVNQLIRKGHFLGPHSDAHLLYNDWNNRDSTLISRAAFIDDLTLNYQKLYAAGVKPELTRYFLPPFEWYNQEICRWAADMGIVTVGLTPGVGTNADYTIPSMASYKSSDQLLERLFGFETTNADGLNGALVLIHPGTHPDRIDKFYLKLDQIITRLKAKGYQFERLP